MKVPEMNAFHILDRITDGFFSLDEYWRFTDINHTACLILLRNYDELIGKEIWVEFPQAIDSPFYEQYTRAMQEQVPVSFEGYYGMLDKWFDVNAYPSENGLSVFFKDITEIKRKLSQNEQHYKSLFEHNPDAVFSLDMNGRYLSVNKAMTAMLGYSKQELSQLPYSEIVVHDDLTRAVTHYAVACSGVTQNYEIKIKRKNGDILSLSITNIPIIVDQEIVGIYGIAKNITDRKYEQEKLQKAKERLESFIRSSADAIWVMDTNDRVLEINPAFEIMFGWTAVEMIGRELPIVPDSLEKKMFRIHKHVKTGVSISAMETICQRRDGSLLDVSITLSPFRDGSGKIIGLTGICRDITRRKKAEEVLQNAEKLSVAGQLAAGIAHEIRNPITAIKGFIDLLNHGVEHKKEYYDIMISEIERIELILNELLFLAKPQADNFEQKNIRTILDQVTTLLNTQAIMKNVEITTCFLTDNTLLYCDENQLKQVFINFIKNGIESMPSGGKLTIEVVAASQSGLLIRIMDEGIGMPPEILNKLGQPFNSTKETGTGLGFMISKKIIENHSGQIHVKSELDAGTSVEIKLPSLH